MPLFKKFETRPKKRELSPLAQSVLENLENVLNTKREYGSPLADFGVRTLTEYRSREAIALAVMQDIKESIEKYEPRLQLQDITPEESDSPFRISFVVRCALIDGAQVLQLSFDTVFNKFDVTRR